VATLENGGIAHFWRCCNRVTFGLAILIANFGAVLLATGCSRPAPTVAGMAVSFDGSTGQVSIPVVTTASENLTLESWVSLPEGAKGCFIKIGNANSGYGLGVGAAGVSCDDANPGNALIGLYEGVAWLFPSGNPTLSTGAWHHVALVIGAAPSAPTFYIDGTPYPATASARPHAPADIAAIGGNGMGGPRYSNATMADVAVYNTALSADRIAAHATAKTDAAYDAEVLADKPVALYKLDESNGPSANDNSGNSNTGTYSDRVEFGKPGPFASRQQRARPDRTQQAEATPQP
jgi:large repetitive protein